MKLEFELSKKEAQEILGRAIREALAGAAAADRKPLKARTTARWSDGNSAHH